MKRARTLALVVLLLFYGAVGARQPAVRTSAVLGVPAVRLGAALGIVDPDRSHILLDVVRIVFDAPDGQDAGDSLRRQRLHDLYRASPSDARDTVPLPLDPSIWRDTILKRQVPDAELISAILSSRSSALLYHGLAALDDETLAALGPDRELLDSLQRHAGTFATFGRSLRIHAGRVVVPGGPEADPLWQELVGVEPSRPSGFIRRLFDGDSGRLAYFFDALSHLDVRHQLFAIGREMPDAARLERLRALLDVFDRTAPEWRPDERPFMRPPFDPAITLALVKVTAEGAPVAPSHRRLWTRVFRGDEALALPFTPATAEPAPDDDRSPVDAAWIASRVHRAPAAIGRRRLETLLFAQRTLPEAAAEDAEVVNALRGTMAFPVLSLTLERMGLASPAMLTRAAMRAQALDDIRDEGARLTATTLFQSTLGLLDRAAQSRGLPQPVLGRLTDRLIDIEAPPDTYGALIATWLAVDLAGSLPPAADAPDALEDRVFRAMAGVSPGPAAVPAIRLVTWEGQSYRVDPAEAEYRRLRRVRQRQEAVSLDAALAAVGGPATAPLIGKVAAREARLRADQQLAGALTSMLYAAYLGEPDSAVPGDGNMAMRHDLALAGATPGRPVGPWRLPNEEFKARGGWRVAGSLLGLDAALARLALRRIDEGAMPVESRLSSAERRTAALTTALLNPHRLTDAARDEIGAALGRGRARLASIGTSREEVERVAQAAGISEWRREALAWSLSQDPGRVASALSLVELLWLGAPRVTAAAPLDPWGAATQPLTGCSCLEMPSARAWENLAGRPAQGVLATRAADVALLVAEVLYARKLPASLAPAIVALAMTDTLDSTQPAYPDDWPAFTRAAAALPVQRIENYIAALTAGGPLIPVPHAGSTTTRR